MKPHVFIDCKRLMRWRKKVGSSEKEKVQPRKNVISWRKAIYYGRIGIVFHIEIFSISFFFAPNIFCSSRMRFTESFPSIHNSQHFSLSLSAMNASASLLTSTNIRNSHICLAFKSDAFEGCIHVFILLPLEFKLPLCTRNTKKVSFYGDKLNSILTAPLSSSDLNGSINGLRSVAVYSLHFTA